MQWHMKLSNEKVFEDDSFIRSRIRHRLRIEGLAISLGEIASITLHRPHMRFHNIRWPKVIADPSQGSCRRIFKALRVVGGSLAIFRIAELALTVRQNFLLFLHRGLPLLWGDLERFIQSHRFNLRGNNGSTGASSELDMNHALESIA
jgi:hypothetical protein